jgi:hypothetical protein
MAQDKIETGSQNGTKIDTQMRPIMPILLRRHSRYQVGWNLIEPDFYPIPLIGCGRHPHQDTVSIPGDR